MAKKVCCICEKEISRFELAGHPDGKHEDLWFCESCLNQRKNLLQIEDSDASEKADTYFQERASHCRDASVRGYILSMLQTREEMVNKAAEPVYTDLQKKEKQVAAFPMTTGFEFDGFHIADYRGVLSAEMVMSPGFFLSDTPGVDPSGAKSRKFMEMLKEARVTAEAKLVDQAVNVQANALIGVRFHYNMFSGNIMGVIVSGTAVVREKDKENIE